MNLTIHDVAAPILNRFRRRRMQKFVHMFGVDETTEILDVGGNTMNWEFVSVRPHLTFLNIKMEFVGSRLTVTDQVIVGDGCQLPFADWSFDVVFCNSVIEHLGDIARQRQLAREIQRVGKRYFVQTPNYWYPIEPHYIGLGTQFFPKAIRAKVSRWLTVWGWIQRPTRNEASAMVAEISLLSKATMRQLFPDSDILSERTVGLTKSLIAIRR
ncbi:MAG: methyltransferase domain-containing protein [Gemmatimonadota bacterium]